MTTPSIPNVKFISVEIEFYCIVERHLYDLGAVELECEGRTFILDVVQSYTNDDNNHTTITCDLAVDLDTFPIGEPSLYDLTASDLHNRNIYGTMYIGDEDYEVEPDSVTLFVEFINPDGSGCTKAIELNQNEYEECDDEFDF